MGLHRTEAQPKDAGLAKCLVAPSAHGIRDTDEAVVALPEANLPRHEEAAPDSPPQGGIATPEDEVVSRGIASLRHHDPVLTTSVAWAGWEQARQEQIEAGVGQGEAKHAKAVYDRDIAEVERLNTALEAERDEVVVAREQAVKTAEELQSQWAAFVTLEAWANTRIQ
ncbi:hypothetical protein E2562_020885 [Oryza meyeriana var. granulata]|uniref:Uncharacterized protein n=1 Tax=Oryza meyeriana var. granulata TaxID=110450 RepID=A0A6G1D7S5_9ORYZ|nr:hypothetical protein E2562_020885 [Oryza meyeriana var. granulata]